MRAERKMRYLSRYPSRAAILDWDSFNHKHFWRPWKYSKNVEFVRRLLRKFERPGENYHLHLQKWEDWLNAQ